MFIDSMDFSVNDAISGVIIKVTIVKDPLKYFVVSYIVSLSTDERIHLDMVHILLFHLNKLFHQKIGIYITKISN